MNTRHSWQYLAAWLAGRLERGLLQQNLCSLSVAIPKSCTASMWRLQLFKVWELVLSILLLTTCFDRFGNQMDFLCFKRVLSGSPTPFYVARPRKVYIHVWALKLNAYPLNDGYQEMITIIFIQTFSSKSWVHESPYCRDKHGFRISIMKFYPNNDDLSGCLLHSCELCSLPQANQIRSYSHRTFRSHSSSS